MEQNHPYAPETQNAIQKLIKSGSSNASACQSDFSDTCNELLRFNFYSEQGRLAVIDNLSKLNGNFVAKIIRKGLSSLIKVYDDPKTCEDESIKLVQLCVTQYEKQGNDYTSPSPAMMVDCAFELSNELLKSREGTESTSTQILLSTCLIELVKIFETILQNRLFFDFSLEGPNLSLASKDACQFLLGVLKRKIVDESFEDVLHQTAKIASRDANLNYLNAKSSDGQISARLMTAWVKLLEFPFITSWCAVSIAKKDFLLNDEEYSASLQYSSASTYSESLLWMIYSGLNTLCSNDSSYELPSDKERLQIFFDHAEIMLRHTKVSFDLLQSNVSDSCIKEVFEILGIQLNREWLPQMTADQSKKYGEIMKMCVMYRRSGLNIETLNAMRMKIEEDQHSASVQIRSRLTLIFGCIVSWLLILPNQEPVIEILRFWKQNFIDEHYDALFLLCGPMAVATQLDQDEPQRNADRFVEFLHQFPKHLIPRTSISNWIALLVSLMMTFPNSWNIKGNFIKQFMAKCSAPECSDGESREKLMTVITFIMGNLARNPVTETIKAEVLELIWELYDSIPTALEFELALNGAVHVIPVTQADTAKRYLLDFVDAVEGKSVERENYINACRVLNVIANSPMDEKEKVLQFYLQLLKKTSKENMTEAICRSLALMSLPINAANAVRLLELVGKKDRCSCFLIEHCASNLKHHGNDFINDLIAFVLIVVENTLQSDEDRKKFAETAIRYIPMINEASCDVDVCQILLACIAGSIAVKTFDERGNNIALSLVCVYLKIRKNEARIKPVDVLNLYIKLYNTYHKVKVLAADDEDYITYFFKGAKYMFQLPLSLIRILNLINIIIDIFEQGNFESYEVAFIMLHFFHSRNTSLADIDPDKLWSHFVQVVTLPTAKDLSQMTITSKKSVLDGDMLAMNYGADIMPLMKLLVELTPLAFIHRESSNLFKFVIHRLKKSSRPLQFSMFILPMVRVSINQNVTAKQFRKEFKEIEKMIDRVPRGEIFPLVVECITEYNRLNDKQGMKALVPLLLERNWHQELQFMVQIMLSYLNAPQQIVSAFNEANGTEEMKNAIQRVLDILHHVHPTILCGKFLEIDGHESAKNEVLQTLAMRDFQMLTRNTSLTPKDVSTVLLVYTTSKLANHIALFKMDKASCTELVECSSDYEKSYTLTPGKLGFLILHHLKNLSIDRDTMEKEYLAIFNELLQKDCFLPQNTTFQEYIEVFVQIMKLSCSLEDMKKYFQLSVPRAIECKEVLLAAYLWKSERKGREESSKMIQKVLHEVETLEIRSSQHASVMKKILETVEDEEVADDLFKLLAVSIPCTRACLDSTLRWSKKEIIALVTKLKDRYENMTPTEIPRTDVCLQILPFISKAFPNSSKEVGDFLDYIIDNQVLDDPLSLGRIPTWLNEMTEAGFSRSVIESWCTSLVHYEKLSSSDVDAITNLTPKTTEIISRKSGQILKCLFRTPAPQTWKDVNIDAETMKNSVDSFKRCLQFAKILSEFSSIAMQLKENVKIVESIKEGTHNLCLSFSQTSKSGELFKIRDSILKEMFGLVFSGEVGITKESISRLNCHKDLSEGFIADFRRLARSVYRRPITFGYVKDVVQRTLSILENLENTGYEEVQNNIHKHVIEIEPNQDAIHALQAAGYNKGSLGEDLWYSTSIQIGAYVPSVESLLEHRLERLLKQTLMEWRGILSDLKIEEISVNGENIEVKDLMNFSDTKETVNLKLEAVKQATKNAPANQWSNARRRHLIQKEKYAKNIIAKQTQQKTDENDEKPAGKLAKMVIVWDNKVVTSKSTKTCSEKIPGCYAPNGFHSEKTVICRLAVDNKILTLYKQDKGDSLTELENVEVKLFPAGMLVYEVYSSGHCYDTDQLWAAFFKMLLLKRLVPKIFLTNVSPGFEWIAKNKFVPPVSSPPEGVTFYSCNTLIPTNEDSYDYEPNISLHRLRSELSNHQMDELIVLTPDNVKEMEFHSLKSPERDQLIRNLMEKVPESVQNSSRLLEKHPEQETRATLTKRLTFAIRKLSEDSVDKELLDLATVSAHIDLEKLCWPIRKKERFNDAGIVRENGKDFYAQIILDALQTEIDGHAEYTKEYDCCEHVQFLQSNEFTTDRDEESLVCSSVVSIK